MAGGGNCVVLLAPLLQEMVNEPALAYLTLVANKRSATAEEAQDFPPDATALDCATWMSRVARSASETPFQRGGHGGGSYRSFPSTPAFSICPSTSPVPAGHT
jgi:hypothetical protein